MRSVLLVFVGGALGTLSRFGVNKAVSHDGLFPVATFAVNVVGSFALGMLLAAILHRGSDSLRLLLGTGFLGGFTTYSALAVETDALIRGDHLALGITYAAASVIVGLAAALAGVVVGSKVRP